MLFKKMKKSTKTTIIIVAIAMVTVMLLGFVTSGFQNWDKDSISDRFEKKVNPDNLYTVECMTLDDTDDGYGIVITTNDDGSFTAKGTAAADRSYEIGEVKLPAGTYTLTAFEGATRNTVYVTADIGGGNLIYADFSGNTFELAEETTVTLKLEIKDEAKINAVIYPVIVAGEESGEFYQ